MSNEVVASVLWSCAGAFLAAAFLVYLTIGDLEHDEKATLVHRLLPLLAAGCIVYAISLVSQGFWVRSDGAPADYRVVAWLLVPTSDYLQLLATGVVAGCIMVSVLIIRRTIHGERGDAASG